FLGKRTSESLAIPFAILKTLFVIGRDPFSGRPLLRAWPAVLLAASLSVRSQPPAPDNEDPKLVRPIHTKTRMSTRMEPVRFSSLGVDVVGALFLPEARQRSPALIVCHGAGE